MHSKKSKGKCIRMDFSDRPCKMFMVGIVGTHVMVHSAFAMPSYVYIWKSVSETINFATGRRLNIQSHFLREHGTARSDWRC